MNGSLCDGGVRHEDARERKLVVLHDRLPEEMCNGNVVVVLVDSEVIFNENEIHLAQRLFRFQEFHSVKFFVKDR